MMLIFLAPRKHLPLEAPLLLMEAAHTHTHTHTHIPCRAKRPAPHLPPARTPSAHLLQDAGPGGQGSTQRVAQDT